MADAPWSDPTEPDFFQMRDHNGSLVLLAVNEYISAMTTAMGTSPAIRAEIVVVDGPDLGGHYPEALLFGRRLVPQLKASVGEVVLGRIAQGVPKAGQNPPWELDKATDQDKALANNWVQTHGPLKANPIAQTAHQQPTTNGGPQLPPPPKYPAQQSYTQPAGVGPGDDEPPF